MVKVPTLKTEIQKTGEQEEEERKKTEINKQEEIRAEKEKQKHLQKEQRRGAIKENIHAVMKRKGSKEIIIAVVIIFSILLVGYWIFPSIGGLNGTNGNGETPTPIPKYSTNSIDMEFVLIPAGEFDMGSQSSEVGRDDDEGPVHHVTIPEPFYMSKYEVTQKQWREVMGSNPSYFNGDNLPVEKVSWNDVREFIEKLNDREGMDKYCLPSEAEWEYTARAGNTTQYSFGDDESDLGDYAWYDGAPSDGSSWEDGDGTFRVIRGVSWRFDARYHRSAYRTGFDPDNRINALGFRLLQEL